MVIWTEPDSDEPDEGWIDMTGDDLAFSGSSTWKLEAYASIESQKG